MKINFEPSLVDKVVIAEIDKRATFSQDESYKEYHRIADQIYLLNATQRQSAVQNLHSYYFLRFGMKDAIKNVIDGFGIFENRIQEILVKGVGENEGCFLNDEQIKIFVRLRIDRFANLNALAKFLRNELMHISDMLNERFKYPKVAKHFGESATENIIRDRYALLWNIHIDGRLARAGKDGIVSEDLRRKQFHAMFKKFPAESRDKIFDGIFKDECLTHPELIAWAKEPELLIKKYISACKVDRVEFLSGSPCPLCTFPTYNIITNGRLVDGVLKLIASDFPFWNRKQGACDRCVELYEVRAGVW